MAERYILPWIYTWFAYQQLSTIHRNYVLYIDMVHQGLHQPSWSVFGAGMVRYVLMALLAIFMGLTFLGSRRPTHLPNKLGHILVPMAMSFYFFLYSSVDLLPPELRVNLLPEEWQVPAAAAAVCLSILGYTIALWGIFYLRRSFAILVAVRKVVSGGPYAYVRHPMYLGYIVELTGLVLASFCLGMIAFAAGFVLLVVVRAQMEEDRLLEACPEYRDYMKRTGFIFPRFRGQSSPTP
jgi:protein-S-isoprenylcysteine O-methyltransferase Ste14